MSGTLEFVRPGIYRAEDGTAAHRVARIEMRGGSGDLSLSLAIYAPGREHSEALPPMTIEDAVRKAWNHLRRTENQGDGIGWDEGVITVGDGEPVIHVHCADRIHANSVRVDRVRQRNPEMWDAPESENSDQ